MTDQQTFMVNQVVALVSSGLSKIAMAPLDRVKILLQTSGSCRVYSNDGTSQEMKKFTGISDCIRRVHSEQGFKSFFRGNLPAMLPLLLPTSALNFVLKDFYKNLLNPFDPKT